MSSMFDEDQWEEVTGDLSAPPAWSRIQDKLFEQALVVFPEGTPDRWGNIAAQVPGKSAEEVRRHYEDLVHDVLEIDSGRVDPPSYANESRCRGSSSTTERKKGVPWTEDEHRLFLIGLQKYGRGDWRSISRNAVVTRTPTQVASHAQKYYLRLNSAAAGDGAGKKEKKRSSIHDITTADNFNFSAQPMNHIGLGPPPLMDPMGLNEYSLHGGGAGPSTSSSSPRSLYYHQPFGFRM